MIPKLTIAMPLYNDAKYVQQTIEAILSQSFKNFQLIIIDDCSTDNSVSIVNELANVDSRISLFQNPSNLGNLRNFLKLIEYSNTEYFCWIGSHDLVDRSYYKILIDELESDDSVNYAYGRWVSVDELGNELSKSPILNIASGQFSSDRIKKFFTSIGKARSNEIHFHGVYRSQILNGFNTRQTKAFVGWDHVVSSVAFYYGAVFNQQAEIYPRVFKNRTGTMHSRLVGTNSWRIRLQPTFISLLKSYVIEYWNLPESTVRKILNFPKLIMSVRKGYNIKLVRNIYWELRFLLRFIVGALKF
jgi:glycosyltransferase involved in cell wall biosynthesis